MKISIFGLGYVGTVNAACFAKIGHKVIVNDIQKEKVEALNKGFSSIIEPGIDELIKIGVNSGNIKATLNYKEAINNSEISFITVGTPSLDTGHINLKYIFDVVTQIAEELKNKNKFHTIVIRSTVLPGTNKKVVSLIENISNKKEGVDFAVVSNPEFLREGSAIKDFMEPPFTLVGTNSKKATKILKRVYEDIKAEFITADIGVVEMMKYVNNTYHALKIDFANEVGNICKALNIDSHEVMNIFCKDTQLNISPYYFKPGFAFGGSCLPKDSKALSVLAQDLNLEIPIIDNVNYSNEIQKMNAIKIIESKNKKNIGILGLSFKSGTDDLRCSPIVDVINYFIKKEYNIKIYDINISDSINKNFDKKLIYWKPMLYDDLDSVIQSSEVLVISKKEKKFEVIPNKYPKKIIIDLVRQYEVLTYDGIYEGISWCNINKFEDK